MRVVSMGMALSGTLWPQSLAGMAKPSGVRLRGKWRGIPFWPVWGCGQCVQKMATMLPRPQIFTD